MLVYDPYKNQSSYIKECKVLYWSIPRANIGLAIWRKWSSDHLGISGYLEYFLEERDESTEDYDYFDSIGLYSMQEVLQELDNFLRPYVSWYDRIRIKKWITRNMKIVRRY